MFASINKPFDGDLVMDGLYLGSVCYYENMKQLKIWIDNDFIIPETTLHESGILPKRTSGALM